MRSTMLALLVAVLLVLVGVSQGDVNDCKVYVEGKLFDLSQLKKDYEWNQTVINTGGNLLTNPDFSDTVNISFQLGICQNVSKPMSGCEGSAPVFMMRSDTKKCIGLGSLNVARFEANPFNDGVYLDYYNGDAIDHITRYEARVYFVCSTDTIVGPKLEHLKDSDQAHFHVFTKYAC